MSLPDNVIQYHRDRGIQFPISLQEAKHLRMVGKKTLQRMQELGLVPIKMHGPWPGGLSTRSGNVMANAGLLNKDDAVNYFSNPSRKRLRNMGKDSEKEILKALGLDVKKDTKPRCPCCGHIIRK